MKVIYEPYEGLYLVKIEYPETLTWINTRDITVAKEKFIESMTELFNDAICEALKD